MHNLTGNFTLIFRFLFTEFKGTIYGSKNSNGIFIRNSEKPHTLNGVFSLNLARSSLVAPWNSKRVTSGMASMLRAVGMGRP